MKVLFFERSLDPSLGGVERVTWLLSQYLCDRNVECFYAYYKDDYIQIDDTHKVSISIRKENKEDSIDRLSMFILNNKIDIIVNQGEFEKLRISILYKLICRTGVYLITCLHLSPDFIYYSKKNASLKTIFVTQAKNILSYIGFKKYAKEANIRKAYAISNKFVLLSKNFIPQFRSLYKLQNLNKIEIIPDPCTFSERFSISEYNNKHKEILIISRLEDVQKNITGALRIWKDIEDRGHEDWTLILGGYGPDENVILKYAKKLKLRHFRFEGRIQNAIEYYKTASIFMMTSRYEGFGMTLTEALQMGCVPLAFNSYSSLTDIIEDEYNGFVIENGNHDMYVKKLELLISNDELRSEMQRNAVKSSGKFNINAIGKQWLNLLNQVKS